MRREKRFWFYLAAVVCLYLLLCGFAPPGLPQNTFIDGVNVSGMASPAALAAVREHLAEELADKVFTIRAGGRSYSFRYPEIYYETNAREVMRAAQGGEYVLKKSIRLTKIDDTLRGICDDFYKRSEDAQTEFLPSEAEPFRFSKERAGQFLNGAQLKEEVEAALANGAWEVSVQPQKELPRLTEAAARAQASLLSAFTTYFSAENAPRAHNIALAAEKLNGTVLEAGEILSFNKRVGPRTAKNGFLEAPIIKAGEYVPGLGGGVCQASTTLYNAALLAGLEIKEYHPHSLASGYIEPSFDAMVSGASCDLKIKNTLAGKVYLVCRSGKGWLKVGIYGRESPVTYVRESVVLNRIAPPEAEVREGEEDSVIRAEKEGIVSEGYLIRREAGKPDKRVRIRRDKYAPVQGILMRRPESAAEQTPAGQGEGDGNADGTGQVSSGRAGSGLVIAFPHARFRFYFGTGARAQYTRGRTI